MTLADGDVAQQHLRAEENTVSKAARTPSQERRWRS